MMEEAAPQNVDKSEKPQDVVFQEHLAKAIKTITQQLNDFKIGMAAEEVFNEFWHWFCDEAIEQAKTDQISLSLLKSGLEDFLKLLHPFMPFVTEAVWQEL